MIFETKKIQRETLGEYLETTRESLGMSVEEAARSVGMSERFLRNLESGHISRLPAEVYVVGFLRRIAGLYSIDQDELVSQYKRERSILHQNIPGGLRASVELGGFWRRLEITPKLLTLVLGAGFVAVTVLYVIWQVLSINQSPALEIYEPKHRQLIQQTSVVVSGKTDPGMIVTINDQAVFVDTEGKFTTQLSVSPGPKDLIFTAKNKFDKSVTKVVSIVAERSQDVEPGVSLRLEFSRQVTVSYRIDGGQVVEEQFGANAQKTLEAEKVVMVSTSDAGATRVWFNGQDLGLMGKSGERLENVPFSPEPANINSTDK